MVSAERKLAKAVLARSTAYKLSVGSLLLTACASTPVILASGAFAAESITQPNLQAIPEVGLGLLAAGGALTAGSFLTGIGIGIFGVFPNKLATPNSSQLKKDVKFNNRLVWENIGVTAITTFGTLSGLFAIPALTIGGPIWFAQRAEKLAAAHNRNNQARRVLGRQPIGRDMRMKLGPLRIT